MDIFSAETEHLAQDAKHISSGLRRKYRFPYMSADSVEVSGLKDWTANEWIASLEQHPVAAVKFLQEFLPESDAAAHLTVNGPKSAGSLAEAARLCKERMSQSLEAREWEMVCRWQNLCARLEDGRTENTGQYLQPVGPPPPTTCHTSSALAA